MFFSIISLLISCGALFVSIYSATENIRNKRRTREQPYDLIVRPFPEYRKMPSAALLADIRGINLNPDIFNREDNIADNYFEKESMHYVLEDIEDGGVYYGINVKSEYDPLVIRGEILKCKWFDKAYITDKGTKKHKKFKSNPPKI